MISTTHYYQSYHILTHLSGLSLYNNSTTLYQLIVSGLGFGLMNGAFALMNVLTDHIGPGTVGLKGDSHYFLLVSALTALAFTLLNVSWSVIMSQSVETSDKRLAVVVLVSHLLVTSVVSSSFSL